MSEISILFTPDALRCGEIRRVVFTATCRNVPQYTAACRVRKTTRGPHGAARRRDATQRNSSGVNEPLAGVSQARGTTRAR